MSRWSHEYPERDYSDGSYFGAPAAPKLCRTCDVVLHGNERLVCAECKESIDNIQAEREHAP